VRLILDFVPNHVAPDHRWVEEHPDVFISGTEEQLASQPQRSSYAVRIKEPGTKQDGAYH
jgi:glycosidase